MEDRIVKITVAGKVKEYQDGLNITQLIEKENVETPEYVTVSVNDEFVERVDFEKALKDGSHTAILVYDKDQIIGAGGISYFRVMPTYHNPTGRKAYIMNMYTNPAYRRKGIAYQTLNLLVADAKNKGIDAISLEATEMGRPLYEKFGFTGMNDEMELKKSV